MKSFTFHASSHFNFEFNWGRPINVKFSFNKLFNSLSVTGRYCLCPMLSFLYNEIIVLFSRLAPLCWCVYVYPCGFGRQYQAGSNQLSSEPLGDLARWRACLLPMTRMISLLRGEGHTHIHERATVL